MPSWTKGTGLEGVGAAIEYPVYAILLGLLGNAVLGATGRTWFLILAFVSIGLEFRVSALRQAGWRPVGVFAAATVVNLLAALGLAALLLWNFSA